MRGLFGRGNINVNTAESRYVISPLYVFIGVIVGLFLQLIVLAIVYWGLKANSTGILVILMLMGAGDLFFVGVAVYTSRLYLREEMIDMASLFASYNPQILSSGSGMLQHVSGMVKEGRNEAMRYAQLISELEQLKRTYENLIANSQDMSGNVAPLPNSGNINFTPFIDGD